MLRFCAKSGYDSGMKVVVSLVEDFRCPQLKIFLICMNISPNYLGIWCSIEVQKFHMSLPKLINNGESNSTTFEAQVIYQMSFKLIFQQI